MGKSRFLEEVSKEAKNPSKPRFEGLRNIFKKQPKSNEEKEKIQTRSELIKQEQERTDEMIKPDYNDAVYKYEQEEKKKKQRY